MMSGSEDEADFASADEGEPETEGQGGEITQKESDAKTSKVRKPSGKQNQKTEGTGMGDGDSSKDTNSSETDKPLAQKRKGKHAKVMDTKTDESLSKEVVGKLNVSEDDTVTEKDVQEKKSDISDSGSDAKDSVTDKAGGDTLSKKTVEDDKTVGVTPGKRTEQDDVVGTIDTELDRETVVNMIKSPSSQSIQRPEPDHTSDQEKVLEGLAESAKTKAAWGWGWGSSLLNAASSSVSTFTKEVGEGFHTMIETVESTLNVPAPEKMAEGWEEELDDNEEEVAGTVTQEPHHQPEPSQKEAGQTEKEAAESEPPDEKEKSQSEGANWFSSWGVSNISSIVQKSSDIVQKSGKTFVTGSLDVLESIGKKTFDVIKDHDPGLRKTKGLLFERGDKPNLSQMLRDAKEQREAQERLEQESEEARKAHFGTLFDEFQGLVHLEALEMLSNQSEKKVSSLLNALPPETISSVKPQLLKIKENFEIVEDEEEEVEEQDFVRLVTELFTSLGLGNTPAKLIMVRDSIKQTFNELKERQGTETKPEPKEIHRAAIKSLAEFTSKSIEQFHKTGELILIKKTEQTDLILTSKQLASLSKILCAEVGIVSTQFSESLNACLTDDNSAVVNPLVTNVYLEATNSSSYIQDGFQLLLPVLQQTALEKTQEPDG